MRIILFGLGSIGKRHFDNLRALRPGANIVIAEPQTSALLAACVPPGNAMLYAYRDWRQALAENSDVDGAIIASPTDAHVEQMAALADAGISFYVEKPLWNVDCGMQNANWERMMAVLSLVERHDLRCAAGFQYRYHAAVQASRETWQRNGHMSVVAYDDLLARYGATVGGTMASHPIDLALWTLGDWHKVDLFGDGTFLRGTIAHEGDAFSYFDIRMDTGPRQSRILTAGIAGMRIDNLTADNDMYERALAAWLDYIETGRHDGTLATLGDGLAMMRVLA